MTQDHVVVRQAGAVDIPVMAAVFAACFTADYVSHTEVQEGRAAFDGTPLPGAPAMLAAELPGRLSRSPEGVLVAERGGTVVGFAVARLEDGGPDRYGVVDDLCVLPAHRREGVATALLSAAASALRAGGARAVFAEVGAANLGSQGLFRRAGFTLVSQVYLKPL